MASPRIGKFSTSSTVTWASGALFNGFCLVGIAKPTISASPVHSVSFGNSGMSEPIPDFYRIPIVDGKYAQTCGLFYTADLTPPGAVYYAWLYVQSAQGNYIPVTAASSSFTVSSDSITPPSFTVNNTATGSQPTPDQSNVDTVIPPSTYTLTGNVDAAGYDITGVDNLTGTTATFSGAVGTGALSCTSLTSSGAVSGTTGTFSSAVSGTTGTFSGVVKIADGSTTSPGLEFGSDTNTGLYRPAADNIGLVAGGTESLRVDAASVRYIGSAFKYLDCESDHLAFYKKSGSQRYYWRRSADGTHGGASQFEMASLDEVGNLIIAGFLKANIPAYANNAAAIAGGLVAGQVYHDGTGAMRVVI